MAWTEAELRNAGWVQKKLRLRVSDAKALERAAKLLQMKQSDAVAELVRRFLATR